MDQTSSSSASSSSKLPVPQLPPSINPATYDAEIQGKIKAQKRLAPEFVMKEGLEKLLGPSQSPLSPDVSSLLLLDDCVHPKGSYLPPTSPLLHKICHYMTMFDPIAVRYAGAEWRRMLDTIYVSAMQANMPQAAILPIRTAMLRLDPTGGTFTSMHTPFLKLCLQAGSYSEALPIIDKVIHSFPAQTNHGFDGRYPCSAHQDSSGYITVGSGLTEKVHARTVQEYYLLAAMICIGVGRKNWPDALLYLEMVLFTPTQNVVTGFMVEAYRKWLILHLLIHGKPRDVPKVLGSHFSRQLKSATLPYQALVQAFQSAEPQKLFDEIKVGLQVWDEDGNLGLVLTLADYITRFCIIDLSKRFTSIPITAIARNSQVQMPPDQTLELCEELIRDGAVKARIEWVSNKEPVLRFTQPKESESELLESLSSQVNRISTLADFVKLSDSKMLVSREYMRAIRHAKQDEIAQKNDTAILEDNADEENLMDETIGMDDA